MQRGQFGLQRGPYGRGEPLRCLHHDVDHEGAADQPHLGALPVQVGYGPVHLLGGALPHPSPAVQHAVHRGLAQARLTCDFPEREGMTHGPAP